MSKEKLDTFEAKIKGLSASFDDLRQEVFKAIPLLERTCSRIEELKKSEGIKDDQARNT